VLAELSAVGREETVDGVAALYAAAVLDEGGAGMTGTARASLLKEMRASAASAIKGAAPAASKLDEIRRRRERRSS
jgi:hypothetical protein